jgi:predicted Fe-S protein YdhL (DUF1289 family)
VQCYRTLEEGEAWLARSSETRQRVVRMSLEMRMVVSLDG